MAWPSGGEVVSRVVHRYSVFVDHADYQVPAGRVVHVSADRGGKHDLVEVWVEHPSGAEPVGLMLNVHGTGHPIPEDGRAHVGSCVVGLFVWHVYAKGVLT